MESKLTILRNTNFTYLIKYLPFLILFLITQSFSIENPLAKRTNLLAERNQAISNKIDSLKIVQVQKNREMDSLAIAMGGLLKINDSLILDLDIVSPMTKSVDSKHKVYRDINDSLVNLIKQTKTDILESHQRIDSLKLYNDSLKTNSSILLVKIDSTQHKKELINIELDSTLSNSHQYKRNKALTNTLDTNKRIITLLEFKRDSTKLYLKNLKNKYDVLEKVLQTKQSLISSTLSVIDSLKQENLFVAGSIDSIKLSNDLTQLKLDSITLIKTNMIKSDTLLQKLKLTNDDISLIKKNIASTQSFIQQAGFINDSIIKVINQQKISLEKNNSINDSLNLFLNSIATREKSLINQEKLNKIQVDNLKNEQIQEQVKIDKLMPRYDSIQSQYKIQNDIYLNTRKKTDSLHQLKIMSDKEIVLLQSEIDKSIKLNYYVTQQGNDDIIKRNNSEEIIEELKTKIDSLKKSSIELKLKNSKEIQKFSKKHHVIDSLTLIVDKLSDNQRTEKFKLDSLSLTNQHNTIEADSLEIAINQIKFKTIIGELKRKQFELEAQNNSLLDKIEDHKEKILKETQENIELKSTTEKPSDPQETMKEQGTVLFVSDESSKTTKEKILKDTQVNIELNSSTEKTSDSQETMKEQGTVLFVSDESSKTTKEKLLLEKPNP